MARRPVARRLEVEAITFDFGNTLVRVDRLRLRAVLEAAARRLHHRGAIADIPSFLEAWATERDRQFRLQVPRQLEVDLGERMVHVLARLRGAVVPRTDAEPWDEAAAAACSDPAEAAFGVEVYSEAFVATMPPLADATATLRAAHERGFRLGVLSNWPHAATVDRYLEARGWYDWFEAVVVSQRVGVIKPHPRMFAVAAECLGASPERLLHVGDDWAADVEGGRLAGWRVAYLRGHQGDTPLPTSSPTGVAVPDLELDGLAELPARVALARP